MIQARNFRRICVESSEQTGPNQPEQHEFPGLETSSIRT